VHSLRKIDRAVTRNAPPIVERVRGTLTRRPPSTKRSSPCIHRSSRSISSPPPAGPGISVASPTRAFNAPSKTERVAGSFGEQLTSTVVELRSRGATYLSRPEAIPFHTDHPSVAMIGWWCERQDEEDGASLLLDGRALVESLDHEARIALEGVFLQCPALTELSTRSNDERPVVSGTDAALSIYYADWLRPRCVTAGAAAAWDLLRGCVRADSAKKRRGVRLGVGDALFIDNRRKLHGRGVLAPTSRRCLRRVWLCESAEGPEVSSPSETVPLTE
jgi:hypothetical protein